MNSVPSAQSRLGDLFIEFDARQVTFQTDIPEVREYVAETFQHMLVPRANALAASVSLFRITNGYALQSAESIRFPAMAISELFPVIKDEVRMQFMRTRPDLLWLHAGAVERNGEALLLSGPSGQGKSTLTTGLCEAGWRLLSDDIAPVRMHADDVLPFPQSAVRRVHPGHEVLPHEVSDLRRETITMEPDRVVSGDVPIRAMVFINYQRGAGLELKRLQQGSAAMEMLRNLTNFVDHKKGAVDRVAELARRLPVYALVYDRAPSATRALDNLFT